jgi:hypothetical protein
MKRRTLYDGHAKDEPLGQRMSFLDQAPDSLDRRAFPS